eukprot:symbB.v1.2.019668.t1/scaffold1618.1/size109259/2
MMRMIGDDGDDGGDDDDDEEEEEEEEDMVGLCFPLLGALCSENGGTREAAFKLERDAIVQQATSSASTS